MICKSRTKEEQTAFERRFLIGFTALTLVGYLMEIIAVSTDSWLLFYVEGGSYQEGNGRFLWRVYSGLWRICKVERTQNDDESTEVSRCEYHDFFPTNKEIIYDETIDRQILDYMRTGCAFSVITIILMFLVHAFAAYTIRRPRYTFKRLTALLHIMTGACIIVMNEVFIRTTEYAESHLPERFPQAEYQFGYSFVLSWIVFVFYIAAGIAFLVISHKRKAKMGESEDEIAEEDEPMQIRR